MRHLGLTHRLILGSILMCTLLAGMMGFALRRLSAIVDAATHLSVTTNVMQVGFQVQDDLYDLLQAKEKYDQYISEQTWRHYFEFSQRIDTLIDRVKELRQFRTQAPQLDELDRTRIDLADLLKNATYSINPNFNIGAISAPTLMKLKDTRATLQSQIADLMMKERKSRLGLEASLRGELQELKGNLWLITSLFLVGALLFALYLHHSTTAPLRRLIDVMRKTTEGQVFVPVPPAGAPEIREMISTFNVMEESLFQHQKRLASMLSLAVTVAHEVRNPIAAIGAAVQALQGAYPPDAPDREIFPEIRREIHRVDSIISDLLVFARPRPLEYSQMKMSELAEEARILMRSTLESRGVTFRTSISPDADRLVADRNQLHRVLLNLFNNSLDAMPKGGEIRVTTEPREDDRILCTIEDSGPGISPENKEKIFEPFFTTKTKGTGLGLSIVQGIVERHQGSLQLGETSRIGGACFVIILPRGLKRPSSLGVPSIFTAGKS